MSLHLQGSLFDALTALTALAAGDRPPRVDHPGRQHRRGRAVLERSRRADAGAYGGAGDTVLLP